MDRLSIIAHCLVIAGFGLLFSTACRDDPSGGTPVKKRFVAIKAKPVDSETIAGFCDVAPANDQKKRLQVPPLHSGSRAEPKGAYWVNVWATWCKPCIEEMPMLIKWEEKLNREEFPTKLNFVSADETPGAVDAFRKSRSFMPESSVLADPESLEPWMTQLGLDQGAGLPIHIFVGADGFIRCVRAAAISPGDYSIVVALLRGA